MTTFAKDDRVRIKATGNTGVVTRISKRPGIKSSVEVQFSAAEDTRAYRPDELEKVPTTMPSAGIFGGKYTC